jgi:hypothetical protein
MAEDLAIVCWSFINYFVWNINTLIMFARCRLSKEMGRGVAIEGDGEEGRGEGRNSEFFFDCCK